MPSVYQLKPGFQRLLRPLVRSLATLGVTANQVTLASVALSVAAGSAVALNPGSPAIVLGLPLVLLIRMGLNAIDGMLAREYAMKSRTGAVLNELGDGVSDIALYLPLALVPPLNPILVVLFVCCALLTELSGVVALQVGSPRRYEGPMGKSDRAFWAGLLTVLLGLKLLSSATAAIYLSVLIALSSFTVWHRCQRALGVQRASERGTPNPAIHSTHWKSA